MIVKIKNNKNCWSYLECTIVHTDIKLLKDVNSPGECLRILSKPVLDSNTTNVKILNLETQVPHFRRVITDMPVYLINDQGKTIDRL